MSRRYDDVDSLDLPPRFLRLPPCRHAVMPQLPSSGQNRYFVLEAVAARENYYASPFSSEREGLLARRCHRFRCMTSRLFLFRRRFDETCRLRHATPPTVIAVIIPHGSASSRCSRRQNDFRFSFEFHYYAVPPVVRC
jgi:hypothetical protein